MMRTVNMDTAAGNAGFRSIGAELDGWRKYSDHRPRLHVWLRADDTGRYLVALPHRYVYDGLRDLGQSHEDVEGPTGTAGVLSVSDTDALHELLQEAYRLAPKMPTDAAERLELALTGLEKNTDAYREQKVRVGQDIFRTELLRYWNHTCALTGLQQAELLLASHIRPWADCEFDRERLDVYNGLLLAPHMDALFDKGFITFDSQGVLCPSPKLSKEAQEILRIADYPKLSAYTADHDRYMEWHREKVFGK